MSLMRNKSFIRSTTFFALLFMFCGHAFCYANLSFSGASVMVDASRSNGSLIAGGQFLATFYWRVRGSLSAPLTVGLLSALYLTASAILIADMLKIAHPLSLFALCGSLSLHISVTAINASMLHVADVYFLAFLLAVLSVWLCQQHPLGCIAGAVCFAAVPGLESSMLAAAPALLLIACLTHILDGMKVAKQLIALFRSFCGLILGFALYYAAAFLFCRRQGVELNAAFQLASSPLDMYLYPLRQLFAPTTAYASFCAFLSAILITFSLLALFARILTVKSRGRFLALVCALLLPLTLNMPVFSSEPSPAVSQHFVFCLLPVAMIAIIDRFSDMLVLSRAHLLRTLTAAAFGITFLSSVVFANQVYLKKNLEYQSTLSVMTRVIEMAEQTDGFDPNTSAVAVIGNIEDSAISIPHKGFEHLAVLDAAANNFTVSTQENHTWYFWEIMGYPFNFISDYERDQLAATAEVQAMPAFPDQGCCQMIDGTLVIRLSE